MPARVTIFCGPARCGKTRRLLTRYRAALAARPPGAALWLAPTWRAAAEIRRQLLDASLSGCFQPGVMTFGNFAEAVLRAARLPIRPVSRLMKRELVRQILFEQSSRGRLRHFQSIAKTSGLVDLVCEFISELKRLEIWPEKFQEACAHRGIADKDVELFEIYDAYQQSLREHGLFDAEGRFWSARDLLRERGERGEGRGESERDRAEGGRRKAEEAVVSGQWPVASEGTDNASGTRAEFEEQTALTLALSQGERGPNTSALRPPPSAFPLPSPLSPLPSPLFIVADGFTDFTRTQHEILGLLARQAEEMFVTLPLEGEPCRGDLFAKPRKTLDELRRRHPGAIVEGLDRPVDSAWPAIDWLERMLFENPRRRGEWREERAEDAVASGQWLVASEGTDNASGTREEYEDQTALTLALSQRERGPNTSALRPPPSALRLPPSPSPSINIEILAAARPLGEIELVAGRIKRLLAADGVKPGDVAVVFRSLGESGEVIDEVFGRLGIPFVVESGQTLDRAPALRALAMLLQLDLDDWPFDRLLAILGGNYFQPDWPAWREAGSDDIGQTIRALQVPRGRRRLIEQFSTVEGDSQQAARCVVERLAAAFDAMPQQATLPDWAKAWRRLAGETGLLRAMNEARGERGEEKAEGGGRRAEEAVASGQWPVASENAVDEGSRGVVDAEIPPSALAADRRAWGRLMESLDEGDRLAAWLDRRPPELNRSEALETLLDILRSDRLGHAGDESGCVRVLSAESVRSLRVPYLFLAGLSEKAFPPPDRDDRLYNEADYARLIDAGLPLVGRAERTREEMLLFYEAITRATERLYLSYPALDDSAQPLLPSPFLSEVEEAFPPGSIPRVERTDLSPIPADDEPLCQADFRVKAMASALAGNVSLLAGLLREGAGEEEERGEGRGESEGTGKASGTRVNLPSPFGRGAGGEGDKQRAEGGGRKVEETDLPSPIGKGVESEVGREAGQTALTLALSQRERGPLPPSALRLPPSAFPLPCPSPLLAGLELIHLRQERDRFGPAEGVLQSEAVREILTTHFSPQHTFSATDLERYASCPFRYFMERILKIEPLVDLTLEFDLMQRGRVVHEVLSTFHRRANERLGGPASPLRLDPAEFDALLAASIAESLPTEPNNPVQAALGEVDRRLVVEWLSQYRAQVEKYDEQWKDLETPMAPTLFEVSFGREGEEPPSCSKALEFVIEGQAFRIAGRIDRIDVGKADGKTVFNVLDYKSGGSIKLTPESVKAGTTLQLPIYALAGMEMFMADRDAIPWRAAYWYVRDGGFKPRQALRMYWIDQGRIELDPGWEIMRAGLGETVAGLIHAIRAGRFPVCSADDRCTGHCPYSSICRINQVRSLEKTCQPTSNQTDRV